MFSLLSGREFCNELNATLFKLTGVEHQITGAYHPQANGLVEKQNSTTTNALKACLNQQEDWYKALDSVAFSFRGSKHCSTGRTPFEMMFGHQMLLPVELHTRQLLMQKEHTANNLQENGSSYPSQEEILEVMTNIREQIHNVVAKNISKAQACQAKNYNLRHQGETLKVRDKIMKKHKKAEQRKGDKLRPRWLGPYLITAVHDNGNYMVADPRTGKVLATRCLQSECKLYIDLVLGTTEKHYQGKRSFYNARVALQYTFPV